MTADWIGRGELQRRFNRRLVLLGGVQMAGFAAIAGRLYQLQVLEGSRYAPLADDNRTSLRIIAPIRGRILDRTGVVLADNEQSYRVSLVPSLAGDVKTTLALVGEIVPLTAEARSELALRARRAGRGATLIVASNISFEQVAALNLLAPQLPGIEVEIAYTRRYYSSTDLAHVVGYVGGLTQRAIDDDAALQLPGTKIGKSGIERALEKDLRGTAGARRSEVDARGRIVRHIDDVRPQSGADVHAAIDVRFQSRMMQRLARERRAAAVVMDVTNGDILALGSVPTFDNNDVANPASVHAWQRLSGADDNPLFNRALSGQYPPGSTFKLVTALAGLDAGLIDPAESVPCRGSYAIGDQTYRCWKRHGHGAVNLRDAIKESCDVYFYEMARRMGMNQIAAMARALGFGESQAAGAAPEKDGIVPDAEWKRWTRREGWALGDTVIAAVGQGFVLATPLQLAVMTARIATGRKVVVRLASLEKVEGPAPFAPLEISPAALERVREAMVAVVHENGGTGSQVQPSGNVVVAGKTGTSQVRRNRTDDEGKDDGIAWENRDHALFVAYFPAEQPKYAVSAVIEHGGAGGVAAGPLVRDIIELLLELDPAGLLAAGAPAGEAPTGVGQPPPSPRG